MPATAVAKPRREPKVRRDGRCATCGGPRGTRLPKQVKARDRARLLAMLMQDGFCSSKCCRAYFGCSLPAVDGRTYPEAET